MKILVTHPGKIGDLIWALATAKSIAYSLDGGYVDIATTSYCAGLLPLLDKQDWINSSFVIPDWEVEFSAPVTPIEPRSDTPELAEYDAVYHLGMREWPSPTLYDYYPKLMKEVYGIHLVPQSRAWLDVPPDGSSKDRIEICWSDEWKELKAGLTLGITGAFPTSNFCLNTPVGSAFAKYLEPNLRLISNLARRHSNIYDLARCLRAADLVVTCNSMPHPLADALGRRVVVIEPSPPRQQAVFKREVDGNTYIDGFNIEEVIDTLKKEL